MDESFQRYIAFKVYLLIYKKIKYSIFYYHVLWLFLDELKIENNKKNEK